MPEVAIIGVDLEKRVFQLHGAAVDGSMLFRKKLRREGFLSFLASQPPCVVAMEACATAHGWGREIERVGHSVRLIPPITTCRPRSWRRQKNDVGGRRGHRGGQLRGRQCASVAVKSEARQAAKQCCFEPGTPSRPAANAADQCTAQSPCRTRGRGTWTRVREEVSRRHCER